ncbi:MAG: LL-diaminopimelate aminotransferase [Chlamydiae bacterium]|nr:LL-diaminopimelate aminotransferase [Chlamydiota bacterium]
MELFVVNRNKDIADLSANYLFREITQRKNQFLQKNPDAKLINLGIGDTTQPLSSSVVDSFIKKAHALKTPEGYQGYGDDFGLLELRKQIASKLYNNRVDEADVFISDGAKCDLGRLQLLFDRTARITIQDPSYPVYIDTSLITGKNEIVYMSCSPENHFFKNLDELPSTDLIAICSPNNPTGAVLSHSQLKSLVDEAKRRKSVILFDAAYSNFIQDSSCPRSIYEIEGAKEVAIEINSFSKLAGFTGVRLGWSVVPKELTFNDGTSIQKDWIKIITTFFNGASNLAQQGGLACLSNDGLIHSKNTALYYLENAAALKQVFEQNGYKCYGGVNAPYLWIDLKGQKSWDVFDHFLTYAGLITTPGIGFGPSGEGFLRISAFAHKECVVEAVSRFENIFKKNKKEVYLTNF